MTENMLAGHQFVPEARGYHEQRRRALEQKRLAARQAGNAAEVDRLTDELRTERAAPSNRRPSAHDAWRAAEHERVLHERGIL